MSEYTCANKEVVIIVDDSKYMKNHPYYSDTYKAAMGNLDGIGINGIEDWQIYDRINTSVFLINDEVKYLVKPTDDNAGFKREDFKQEGGSKLIDGIFEIVKYMKEYKKNLPSSFNTNFQYIIIATGIDDSSSHTVEELEKLLDYEYIHGSLETVYVGLYPNDIKRIN